MVIACSNDLSLTDNKEKVRMNGRRFIKVKYLKDFTMTMYLFTTIVRMQRNQPKIHNHNFIEFLVKENF